MAYSRVTRIKIEREDVKRNRGNKNREIKRDGSNKSNEIVTGNKGNDIGVKKQRLWEKKEKNATNGIIREIRNSLMNIDERKKENFDKKMDMDF